jgi:hypothetical protein
VKLQRWLKFLADGLPDRLIHVDRHGVAHVRVGGYIVATLIVLFALSMVAGMILGLTSGPRHAEAVRSQSLPAVEHSTNVPPNEKARDPVPKKKDKVLVYRQSGPNVIGVLE